MRERRLLLWLCGLLGLALCFWLLKLWGFGYHIIRSADTAGWLAFVTDREGPTHIWVVKANGDQARVEPASTSDDLDPCWQRPDGRTLLFVSNRNGNIQQMFHISLVDAKFNPLTMGGARKTDLHSSVDGERILHIAGGLVSLYDLSKNEPEQLIPPPSSDPGQNKAMMEAWQSEYGSSSFRSVDWGKSEGNTLVGVIRGDEDDVLVVQQFDVRQRKQAAPIVRLVAKRIDVAYHPTEDKVAVAFWQERPSRNEVEERSWIAGTRARSGKRPSGLVIIDVLQGTTTPVFLSDQPDMALIEPSWSPDGTRLAVIQATAKEGDLEPQALALMSATTGGARTASPVDRGRCGDPQWSPDGKKLGYTKGRPGRRDIYLYDLDSGEMKRLAKGGDNFSPRFSPKPPAAQQ